MHYDQSKMGLEADQQTSIYLITDSRLISLKLSQAIVSEFIPSSAELYLDIFVTEP